MTRFERDLVQVEITAEMAQLLERLVCAEAQAIRYGGALIPDDLPPSRDGASLYLYGIADALSRARRVLAEA